MALVNLKDVTVFTTFSKGFRVVEESKSRDGKDYSTRWTVWSDTLGVTEGDIVSVSGFLGAKVNDWTDKDGQTRHSVELSLNSPRLTESKAAPVQSEEPWNASAPAADVWADDESTPF
jgi:single-stranded DNA-binding protein